MEWQRNYVTLKTGEQVRFSLFQRDGSPIWLVRFKNAERKWREKSTGKERKPDALDSVTVIIADEYGELSPTSEVVTWKVAEEKLTAALTEDNKRPKTIKGYLETLAQLKKLFPLVKGPAEIDEKKAHKFKAEHKGKPKSLDTRIRSLKAIFERFRTLKPVPLIGSNPFRNVAAPKLDKTVKFVSKADIQEVYKWLDARFPGWSFPSLLFQVKGFTACRLADLVAIKTSDLKEGGIEFTAETSKTRQARFAKVPAALFAQLQKFAGETYLWEKYPSELKAANQKNGVPTHRQCPEFTPERLYRWVAAIMKKFRAETKLDFSSHDFRKAAFTRAAERNIHPKKVASGFGVTAETLIRYYTAAEARSANAECLDALEADLKPN
jgi:integrase